MNKFLLILKALADRNRLRATVAIKSYGELCACQVVELLQIKGASVSRLLGQLVHAGILKNRKDGRWVYYRIDKSNTGIQEIIEWINNGLIGDEDFIRDQDKLKGIMACDQEDICRKQRGETCCPYKKTSELKKNMGKKHEENGKL